MTALAATSAAENADLLLQNARGRASRTLEVFLRRQPSGGGHVCATGVSLVDFGRLFAAEIRPLTVLIFQVPPSLLNPNYWEPLTGESESDVRAKKVGIITRTEGDRTMIWRSDRVPASRLLQDGIDAPVDLLQGYVLRTTGEGLLKLARAWDGCGRLEWAGLASLPAGDLAPEELARLNHDMAQLRISSANEVMLYSSQDDSTVRIALPSAPPILRTLEALVRGFVWNATHAHVGPITGPARGHLARIAEDVGLSAGPADVIDKGRTVEIIARIGRTPWGVALSPGGDSLTGPGKVLIYYDRIAGLWAVST